MEISKELGSRPLALKVSTVAELLDCSRSQVYSLARSGKLKTINLSGSAKSGIRILSTSLDDFLHSGGVSREIDLTPAEIAASQRSRRISSWRS